MFAFKGYNSLITERLWWKLQISDDTDSKGRNIISIFVIVCLGYIFLAATAIFGGTRSIDDQRPSFLPIDNWAVILIEDEIWDERLSIVIQIIQDYLGKFVWPTMVYHEVKREDPKR